MASFPKEHSTLYFDALVRTQKKESVLAFIMATYYAKKNNSGDEAVKSDIYKRLEHAYGLFRDNVRGYDNGVGSYEGTDSQFSSQYTLGLEMGIWKNSKLDLNDLALKVARNQITITDYFDVVMLNYIQPVNGKIIHPLYQILKYIKENNGVSINKSDFLKALELSDDNSNEAVNALYNILKGTSYFKGENNNLILNIKQNIDELLSKCNKKYLGPDGYINAKKDLENNDEKYIAYLISQPENEKLDVNYYVVSIKDYSTVHKKYFDKYGYMYWEEGLEKKYNIGDIIYLYFSSDNGKEYSKIKMKAIVNDINVSKSVLEHEKYYENVGESNESTSDYFIKVKIVGNTNSEELSYKYLNEKFGFTVPQLGSSKLSREDLITFVENHFTNFNDEEKFLSEEVLGKILKEYYESNKWNKIAGIMLFGIQYGDYIISKNLNRNKIVDISGIGESYLAELNKGISLKDFVSYNKKTTIDNFDFSSITRKEGAFNIIYYGIPGCGKSFIANQEALKLTNNENMIVRTTFYPDYTNSDFIGQIIPKIDENDKNSVLYDIQGGPFTDALVMAIDNPSNYVCLIIEEINRGNAAAIFGDLFQLLDRKDNGISEYNIKNYTISKYLEKHCINKAYNFEKIVIPSNLILIGTMNTSDQNVFTLDTAFKRRWKMRHITNDIEKSKYANQEIPMLGMKWKDFVNEINHLITDNETDLGINGEDKQLGAYFISGQEWNNMNELIKTNDSKEAARIFAEKVLSYIWEDVAKLDKKSMFKKDYKTFDDVVTDFLNNENVLDINVGRE